jgi:hypothetical protein
MSNLYRWPSKDASYQVSIHMTKTWWEAAMGGSVLSFFKAEWKVSDTGSAHWASSMEICFLYRWPSKDASYQVSIHLAEWFQRRRFLEIDQSETRIVCGGHVC